MEVNLNAGPVIGPPDASPVVRPPGSSPEPSPSADAQAIAQTVTAERGNPALERLEQQRLANTPSGIRIRVDEPTRQFVAQILNEAQEVIKQIPPEEALEAAARFRVVTGLLFDSNS